MKFDLDTIFPSWREKTSIGDVITLRHEGGLLMWFVNGELIETIYLDKATWIDD